MMKESTDELDGFGRQLFGRPSLGGIESNYIGWLKQGKFNGFGEHISSNGKREKDIYKNHVKGAISLSWKQVRFIPSTGIPEKLNDSLHGTETYGNPTDSQKAWAIKFSDDNF